MGIDVDEVLAGYTRATYPLIKDICGIDLDDNSVDGETWDIFDQLSPTDQKKVRLECEKSGFCASLPVLEGSQEAVRELRELVDLFAVTAPTHCPTWVWERNEWLHTHFGFTPREVVHTSAKYLIKVDIRIDDNPDHIRAWHESDPEGLSLLWGTARTRNVVSMDPFRVGSWSEVIRRVKSFIQK